MDGETMPWRSFCSAIRDSFREMRVGWSATAAALSILTTAIAASTVVFAVVEGTALRPLPFGAPDRLVTVLGLQTVTGRFGVAAMRDYMLWRDHSDSIDGIAAGVFGGTATRGLSGSRGSQSLSVVSVTTNLFDVLQVRPAEGRLFLERDGREAAPLVVVLSHDAWARVFSSDPDIVGKNVEFSDGKRREIIGVLPAGVSYPLDGAVPDLYVPRVLPTTVPPVRRVKTYTLSVIARIRPGIRPVEAQAEMSRIAPAVVTPLHQDILGPARTWLLLSLAAMAFVLLVAFLTAATLLLTRTIARARDYATRESLGASRGRLVLICVLEGFAIAAMSTGVGVAIAKLTLTSATAALPADMALVSRIGLNTKVTGTAVVVGLIGSWACASTPAWLLWRLNAMRVLTSSGGSVIGDRRQSAWLGTLQAACLAAAYVLTAASGLVVISAVDVLTRDVGFDWHNLFVASFERQLDGVPQADRPAVAETLRGEVLSTLRGVPGVVSAGIMGNGSLPLLEAGGTQYSIAIDGVDRDGPDKMLLINVVTPGYFETMKMQLVAGRGFSSSDRFGSAPVMVINDVAARRLFAEASPLGHIGSFRGERTIVGVVRGLRYDGPESEPEPELYIPLSQDQPRQDAWTGGQLLVRAQNPHLVSEAVVRAIAPLVSSSSSQVRFLDDAFARLTALQRYAARIMSLFGIVALVVTALGVYSTMSLYVAQQTRAIGLRIALGASRRRIMGLVFRKALALTVVGAALGLLGSWLTSNILASLLTGVRIVNPSVYLAVILVLGVVTLCGALEPARRAAARDPLEALRQ